MRKIRVLWIGASVLGAVVAIACWDKVENWALGRAKRWLGGLGPFAALAAR